MFKNGDRNIQIGNRNCNQLMHKTFKNYMKHQLLILRVRHTYVETEHPTKNQNKLRLLF
jgi:hypothetical protein